MTDNPCDDEPDANDDSILLFSYLNVIIDISFGDDDDDDDDDDGCVVSTLCSLRKVGNVIVLMNFRMLSSEISSSL